MKDLDPFDDWFDGDDVDWEKVAAQSQEIGAEDLEGDQDHDDIDPEVAYQLGYDADPYERCPFEHGTEAADRWHDGRDAAELDAWQSGDLPKQYRDPD